MSNLIFTLVACLLAAYLGWLADQAITKFRPLDTVARTIAEAHRP